MNTLKEPILSAQACVNTCGSRESAKGSIMRKIDKLRNEANALQTLLDMLPTNPTPQQDDALYMIINKL